MPLTRTDAQGNVYVPTAAGTWRPVTPEEQAALDTSPGQAFMAGPVRSIMDTVELMAQGQAAYARRGDVAQELAQRSASRAEQFAPLEWAQGGPMLGGEMLLDPLNLVGAGGAGAVTRQGVGAARRTMAERVLQRARPAAERAAGRAQASAGLGGDSVGAAAADVPMQGRAADVIDRTFADLMSGPELTADQARLLPQGEALGFEELPGMRGRADSPGRMFLGAMLSRPDVRYAVQDTLENNAALIERLAMDALQAPGVPFGRGGLAEARAALGRRFDAVRDALPETVTLPAGWVERARNLRGGLSTELAAVIDPVMGAGDEAAEYTISRSDLMSLRSDLNLVASDLATTPGRRLAGNRIGDLSRDLDRLIADNLGPEMAQEWQRTREAWLVSELLGAKGVIQPDGSISWRTVRGVLDRELPDAYRDVLTEGTKRGRLSPELQRFMTAVDYANAFGDLVPNSGTATRMAAQMNTRQMLQGQALRWYFRRQRDRLNAARYEQERPAP